jgi:predicted phosphodiesterase
MAMDKYAIDRFFFLGDAVGYMPYHAEVLTALESIHATCLMGNHEAMLCGLLQYADEKDEIYLLKETRQNISSDTLARIKRWLPYHIDTLDGIKVLFVHGSPWDPLQGYIYPDSQERFYSNRAYNFIFTGHSHRPFISKNDYSVMVNVGSCGLPRDIGNSPSFVLLDTLSREVTLIRLKLEIKDLLTDLECKKVHKDVLNCFLRKGLEGVSYV